MLFLDQVNRLAEKQDLFEQMSVQILHTVATVLLFLPHWCLPLTAAKPGPGLYTAFIHILNDPIFFFG
jgi:hypothetical protein